MHRIIQKRNWQKVIEKLRAGVEFIRAHAGQIAYYACVALVLTAVGVAAERFRGGNDVGDELILPVVELTTPAPKEAEPVFEVPDGMRIQRAYTDWPEWNEALCHWETHAATDYSCLGDRVFSLSEGTIKTIGKSGTYGGFVEVETGEYLLRYASIEPSEDLEAGENIKKGKLIGTTGESMPGEVHMGNHLHLELIQNGSNLDFEKERGKKVSAAD